MSTPLLPRCEGCGFAVFEPHCGNPQCTWLKCQVKTCRKTTVVKGSASEEGT